jgi:hypothetical protein
MRSAGLAPPSPGTLARYLRAARRLDLVVRDIHGVWHAAVG